MGVVVLLIAVVAPFVVFTVPQVVGAEQSYVVVSGSMTPTISPNDAVIVNDVSPTSVEEGDIIAFSERGGSDSDSIDVTTHRVVNVTSGESGLAFKTKGDANEEADKGFVPASTVVGRVAFTIPFIGYVIGFAGSQLGFITLIGVPVGLLVFGEVYDLAVAARADLGRAKATASADKESRAENTVLPEFETVVAARENGAPAGDPDSHAEPTDSPTDDEDEGGADDA